MNHSDQTKQITAQTEKMLIDQYERLYRLAYSYVHNEADALDIVQESACKAITQCKNLKDTEKLFPWNSQAAASFINTGRQSLIQTSTADASLPF